MIRRWVGGSLCAAYLALLTSKYFQWPFGDPGWEYGGIALVLWTIPWGFLTQMLGGVIGLIDRFGWLSDAVAFFLLVGVGGGANAGIILLLSGLRITRVVVKRYLVLISAIALIAQVTAGVRSRWATEYHRPRNVPRDALQKSSIANFYWQKCVYDPAGERNWCWVWNRHGGQMYSEEFVPVDGGPQRNSPRSSW